MPRKPRFYVPGVPVHLVQRGNNRTVCFFREVDYRFYLEALSDAARRYGCRIHAYVLMTNHVHLLLTPEDERAIPRMMQTLGRRFVVYINHVYGRTGTLWEGRHKASAIDSETYLLFCYRYIELNPVRAGMVNAPGDYRWSSHRHHAHAEPDPVIDEHPLFSSLGATAYERCAAYRDLFKTHLDADRVRAVREAVNVGMPLGNSRFCQQIEATLKRRLGYAKRGRPRKDEVREPSGAVPAVIR